MPRGGSHGKMKVFKITTVQITDTSTGEKRYESINYVDELGKVPTHGRGPRNKTREEAWAIAAEYVDLGPTEEITDVNFDHYTKF